MNFTFFSVSGFSPSGKTFANAWRDIFLGILAVDPCNCGILFCSLLCKLSILSFYFISSSTCWILVAFTEVLHLFQVAFHYKSQIWSIVFGILVVFSPSDLVQVLCLYFKVLLIWLGITNHVIVSFHI